ncbi:TRAP transporter small permease [Enterobacteriaceae bacterium BIT-l23]|jgi:TRAP-type C4-dicarboxylate transport system permease small subunit|uniref:TRAP transporter small permease n=1 Tax=Jejubacter sp. L23 TaxID=3092086 RepID=UPI001584ACCA|nr:TRAP transporter small permease [Enterobacteriaceae bacterium BIT-l23]
MLLFRQIELALTRIGLAAIVVIILAGGVGRALGHPLIWSLEVAMVIFAWVSVLAIDYALQTRRHIGIDAVVNLMPPQGRRLCEWFNELLILAFLGCGVWFGWSFTSMTSSGVLPVTEISVAWLNGAVPTGCMLMFITSALHLLRGCPRPQGQGDAS